MIGSSLELALLVLCIEFALVATGLLYFSRRAGQVQEARAVENATLLVNSVERSEGQRREALLITMQDTYRMDPAEAERVVSDFIEREHAFYNALIGVHLGRSGKSLADVPGELTKLIAPWLRITPRGQVGKEAVEALESSKAAVESELSDTRKVLDELMAEYNAAFNRAQQGTEVPATTAAVAVVTATLDLPHDELLSIDDIALETPAPPVVAAPPRGGMTAADLDDLLMGSDADLLDADGLDDDPALDDDVVDLDAPPTPPVVAVVVAAQHIIDLDAPEALEDKAEPEVPMSQADLDALLENLDDDLFNGKP